MGFDGSNGMPVLKFEMQSLRESMIHSFIDRNEEIKRYVIKSIDGAMNQLSQGGLESAIIGAVTETIDTTLRDSIKECVTEGVDEYFSDGNGKDFITKAIQKALES